MSVWGITVPIRQVFHACHLYVCVCNARHVPTHAGNVRDTSAMGNFRELAATLREGPEWTEGVGKAKPPLF